MTNSTKPAVDPRFLRPKKKQTRTKLDKRFQHVLHDPEFNYAPKVDKYGRSIEQLKKSANVGRRLGTGKMNADLERLYMREEEDESGNSQLKGEDMTTAIFEAQDKSSDESSIADFKVGDGVDYMRGEGLVSSSEEEEEEEDQEEEIITLEGAQDDEIIEPEDILQTEDVPLGDETHRFALVNMDWDHVSAMDLLKVFDSFKPPRGVVKGVVIYASEFGKQRLQDEEINGPPQFTKNSEADVNASDTEQNTEEDSDKVNVTALRKYQLERLRYYFAVVTCDSVETATAIYKACDNLEYQHTSVFFDLRFIPDEMRFDEDEKWVRDRAEEVVDQYKPKTNWVSALQVSKPKCTWDEDDPDRNQVLRRKWSRDELKQLDFNTYLASDVDSSDDDGDADQSPEAIREKYLKLLNAKNSDDSDEEKDDQAEEMEVSFTPGLSDLGEKLLEKRREKQEQEHETVFEKYLREKKGRRKERKKNHRNGAVSDDEMSDVPEDVANDSFFADAFGPEFDAPQKSKVSKQKPKSKQTDDDQPKESDAHLELLLMNEDGNATKGFESSDDERRSAKKSKSKRKLKKGQLPEDQEDDTGDFKVNLDDKRFSALLTSPQYAIDPTESKFKKTKNMQAIMNARTKKRVTEAPVEPETKKTKLSTEPLKNENWKSTVEKLKQARPQRKEKPKRFKFGKK